MHWKNIGLWALALVGIGFLYVLWKTHQQQSQSSSSSTDTTDAAAEAAANAAAQQNALSSILSSINSGQGSSNSSNTAIQPLTSTSTQNQGGQSNQSGQQYNGLGPPPSDYNETYDQLVDITHMLQNIQAGLNTAQQVLPTNGLTYSPTLSQAPNILSQNGSESYPLNPGNLPQVSIPTVQATNPTVNIPSTVSNSPVYNINVPQVTTPSNPALPSYGPSPAPTIIGEGNVGQRGSAIPINVNNGGTLQPVGPRPQPIGPARAIGSIPLQIISNGGS